MKKALIVRFSSLGDVVLTSVLFEPLLSAGYKPYLLTFSPYDELFVDDERVVAIGINKENFFEEIKRIPRDFELKIDLHKNLRSLILRFFLRGKWRSYKKESLRRRLAIYFKAFRKPYFVPEAYAGSVKDLIPVKNLRPFIKVSEKRVESFKKELGDYIVLAPGARYKKKRYPYFKELAELFIEKGEKVVIVGDERDYELTKDFPGINLCGRLRLIEVLSIIKGAKLFVGNDSGLLHCARAVKTPAVQIYGATHPTLGFSLYPDEGLVIFKNLDCQPCDLHGKGECKRGDFACLEISPITIFERIYKNLELQQK